MSYEFKHADMRFKPGSFAESVVLDRYAVSSTDPKDFAVGDTVVFIADEAKGTRKVGTITMNNYVNGPTLKIASPRIDIEDRDGVRHLVSVDHIVKPLETTPVEMWRRWAYGAALHELDSERCLDEFSWLFDGYRYSPGGRIQLGLGHEYLGKAKAPLTLVNCFVGPSVERCEEDDYSTEQSCAVDQWAKVLKNLRNQIEVQRRGGGYGVNITDIATVRGGAEREISLHLPPNHRDYDEIADLVKLGKFDGIDNVGDFAVPETRRDTVVIFVKDSIDGIMDALNEMIEKSYAGYDVVVTFGALRPRHAPVSNIGRSSGAASWMTLFALAARLLRQETIDAVDFAELFAFTTNLVEQGGSRRGALMLVYNVDGPVIEKFVTRKRESGRLVGANVSVGVTDAFMERVKSFQTTPIGDRTTDEEAKAHRIWRLIVESAHASAEPGVLFLDRINNESNSWYYNLLDASNPCGEQPLPPNGACNLGHLVLPRFVKGDWTVAHLKGDPLYPTINPYVDYNELERAVRLAVRFQDDMIDYSFYPTPATKAQQVKERRIGIGTMGLGTMLIMLGLRYGSPEAIEFVDTLYSTIAYAAYDESMNIAAEKGSFPAFDYDHFVESGFVKRLSAEWPSFKTKLAKHGIRNVTLLTQAPTGTTGSYINGVLGDNDYPGVSTGIEPYYAFGYERTSRIGTTWISEPIVGHYLGANGHTAILNEDGSVGEFDRHDLPDYFVTAQDDLTAEEHVRMQAAIQRWVDSSISKTINLPADATVDDAMQAYQLAYDLGCKGVTIYVDGSRQAQVLSTKRGGAKLEAHIEADSLQANDAYLESLADEIRHVEDFASKLTDAEAEYLVGAPSFTKRPTRVFGFTEKIRVSVDGEMTKVYVTVNVDETGVPFEVFVNANDASLADTAQALGRTVTQMLRFGGTSDNVAQVVKHLRRGQSNMFSLPSQLARLIEEVAYRGGTATGRLRGDEVVVTPRSVRKLAPCPSCGAEAYDKTACVCHDCGYSSCS